MASTATSPPDDTPQQSEASDGRGIADQLRPRMQAAARAVKTKTHDLAHRASAIMTNLMCLGLVTGFTYVCASGLRDPVTEARVRLEPRVEIDGIKTRRVVTESIVRAGAPKPVEPQPAGLPPVQPKPVEPPAHDDETASAVTLPAALPKTSNAAETWSADAVANAAAICKAALQSPTLRYAPATAMRAGACGDAGPITLLSAGTPNVTMRQAVIANCRVAAAVDNWITQVLQPAARDLLGSAVVSMDGTSSYVCRNRNGASAGPISEHAYANAFDVSAFRLADGRVVDVGLWGATVGKTANPADAAPIAKGSKPTTSSAIALKPSIVGDAGNVAILFLRRIHREACPLFGTVLGPEANDAHRDHLHLDMKDRGGKHYCQ